MERLQNAVNIAKFISKGFFSEVFAQLNFVEGRNPQFTEFTDEPAKKPVKPTSASADLRPGEAVGSGIEHDFEIAQVSQMIQVGDCYVDLRFYRNRVVRIMKKPCAKPAWQKSSVQSFERVFLTDYTPELAKKLKMNFTLAAAAEFTKSEFGCDNKVQELSKESFSTSKAVETPELKVKPAQWTPPEQENHESADSGLVKSTKGKVIFADKATITPQGRKPYSTFTVILQTADRAEVQYSGVELEKLFLAGKFSVGDAVILKKRVETFSKEIGGIEKTGTRNSYEVDVI